MEVTINAVSEVQQEAEFTLTDADLQPHFEEAYKKFAPKVEIKGFRKGRVPMPMIKKMYGEAIEHDTLDTIANESFRSVIDERNIAPIGKPSMVEMNFKRGDHFKFKIQYEVKPSIELKTYKGLAVENPVHVVTEQEVESEIERLRRINAHMLGVTLVGEGEEYVITADVQELAEDGMPLIGKKTKDAQFSLADESLAKGIKDILAKAEVGGEYKTRFEEQHEGRSHSHHISIAVKKIERVELPPFDDELVKKITQEKVATQEEFRGNLKKDIDAYWVQQSDRAVQERLVDSIVKAHDFPVPESLVTLYLDSFIGDIKNRARDKNLPRNFDDAKFHQENKEVATFQAKWGLLREQIIEAEHLTVTDEEIEALTAAEAPAIGIDKEQLLSYYKNSKTAVDRLLSDKLMKFLRANAVITDKVINETVQA